MFLEVNMICISVNKLYVLWLKVCSKVVEGASEQHGYETPTNSVSLKRCLPHPSKLKKRKRRHSENTRSTSRNHHGFDVTAHVAQLKRKQAEFNW